MRLGMWVTIMSVVVDGGAERARSAARGDAEKRESGSAALSLCPPALTAASPPCATTEGACATQVTPCPNENLNTTRCGRWLTV